jgi:hypothetical protein
MPSIVAGAKTGCVRRPADQGAARGSCVAEAMTCSLMMLTAAITGRADHQVEALAERGQAARLLMRFEAERCAPVISPTRTSPSAPRHGEIGLRKV